mmetsp:Transcript_25605/g.59634  ORF Transcript_25605/g.59634 Transcript_25605/m.59634 type:complete len:210 (-) Transcript_25605:1044-1673(-)
MSTHTRTPRSAALCSAAESVVSDSPASPSRTSFRCGVIHQPRMKISCSAISMDSKTLRKVARPPTRYFARLRRKVCLSPLLACAGYRIGANAPNLCSRVRGLNCAVNVMALHHAWMSALLPGKYSSNSHDPPHTSTRSSSSRNNEKLGSKSSMSVGSSSMRDAKRFNPSLRNTSQRSLNPPDAPLYRPGHLISTVQHKNRKRRFLAREK